MMHPAEPPVGNPLFDQLLQQWHSYVEIVRTVVAEDHRMFIHSDAVWDRLRPGRPIPAPETPSSPHALSSVVVVSPSGPMDIDAPPVASPPSPSTSTRVRHPLALSPAVAPNPPPSREFDFVSLNPAPSPRPSPHLQSPLPPVPASGPIEPPAKRARIGPPVRSAIPPSSPAAGPVLRTPGPVLAGVVPPALVGRRSPSPADSTASVEERVSRRDDVAPGDKHHPPFADRHPEWPDRVQVSGLFPLRLTFSNPLLASLDPVPWLLALPG